MARLEAHRRRDPGQGGVVEAPMLEVAVDGSAGQQHGRGAQQTVGGLDAMLFEQANGLNGGEVVALPVAGADLERGDDLAIPLQLRQGQDPRDPAVGPVQGLGASAGAQCAVERVLRNPVQAGRLLHQRTARRAARRQPGAPAAQLQQGLGRELTTRHGRQPPAAR